MATFHPFPRLPLELRTKIWGVATEDRVLKVRKTWHRNQGYWSPTPVPAVTRACRESREHCSYRKAFIIDSSPRYIWANFDCDVVQMRSGLLSEESFPERDEVSHLRIELVNEQGLDETESFYDNHIHNIHDFPKLRSFDLLVGNGLSPQWTDFIKETYWGACPMENVRIVDGKTGEWIDEETSGAYQDYIDTNGGENDDYTRVVDDPEEEEGRVEAMKMLQIPLPRIDLDY
ncbi:hypothetical protein P153DRAFT_376731 [Dothidotthia symphoricarpi CBS 119687]|uniref:2EXR domain-containing protein n=1 Tax=Dothidotthia symphoricarpi CBS 119687 TaxID=1392245 RepID=A0A6A6ABV6_9PLEO|nr:uncharacterized protein P153DRAFT_376731 [Dothidotthia symphoricarpi CBS 119687]KAF2128625.1 hypothetical protein P153DRAFT_376731 [Dothidotthia symphoricarpi CBS 119687]